MAPAWKMTGTNASRSECSKESHQHHPQTQQTQRNGKHNRHGKQKEPRDTIQERAGKGIWGRRLPDSWEIMDAELYAIYAYLRNCADTATENNTACRCLVLSDCKSALIAIERAYRQQAQRSGDNRNLISAILLQLHRLQQHKGYAIFLWTPGHAGVAPNAMADAAAKAYLNQPHNPNTAAAFLMDICEDIIIIQDSRTGDIRDRWQYREAKRMGHHRIIHGTLPTPPPHPNQGHTPKAKNNRQTAKNCPHGPRS